MKRIEIPLLVYIYVTPIIAPLLFAPGIQSNVIVAMGSILLVALLIMLWRWRVMSQTQRLVFLCCGEIPRGLWLLGFVGILLTVCALVFSSLGQLVTSGIVLAAGSFTSLGLLRAANPRSKDSTKCSNERDMGQ